MSDWKQDAAKRRDARNSKDTVRPKGGSKRDTKRWCKGKVGVEHTPKCFDYAEVKRGPWLKGWKLLACTECGKELDTWWPSARNKRNKPDWVTD